MTEQVSGVVIARTHLLSRFVARGIGSATCERFMLILSCVSVLLVRDCNQRIFPSMLYVVHGAVPVQWTPWALHPLSHNPHVSTRIAADHTPALSGVSPCWPPISNYSSIPISGMCSSVSVQWFLFTFGNPILSWRLRAQARGLRHNTCSIWWWISTSLQGHRL